MAVVGEKEDGGDGEGGGEVGGEVGSVGREEGETEGLNVPPQGLRQARLPSCTSVGVVLISTVAESRLHVD